MSHPHVTLLTYQDETLARLALPGGTLHVTRGLGSGLARRAGDPAGMIWAIGDRGPNLKMPLAIERYGLDHLADHAATPGAKLMPCPDVGPAIVELHVGDRHVTLRRTLPLRDGAGRTLSGLPPAGTDDRAAEPAIDLAGQVLPPDPGGADTEGLACTPDGGFWVGDEYGPSLLRLDPDGTVRVRWVPAGTEASFAGAGYPVVGALPALAARRRLNRGFEGLALSTDGRRLHLAFQSPLAHPDDASGRHARHVRFWTLDTADGTLLAEHAYRLDKPKSFHRDAAQGDVDRADVKLCDLATTDDGRLVVLERISATARLYAVTLDPACALDPRWSDPATRPTLETLSADGTLDCPVLAKTLLFSTDDHPEIGADLEGLVFLDARSCLLVNDNDFGVEGAPTRFWRVEL
ncbi:esterase-like activity of phytase family protein [Sphingomonas montana]|uniref:esterase-like activity of phytase family protein n=1 Tax=Sphingomonas montana TaxID=1843236 RepID=UPI00096C862A|nr:esterase-like activity of phytase family protein [Sphingomonas montana]